MRLLGKFVAGIGLAYFSSIAAGAITITSLTYPAWLVRNHEITALFPGQTLRDADLVRSGDHRGRILIELPDGSQVRLGGSARFLVESSSLSSVDGNHPNEISVRLLRGSFRFTSSSLIGAEGGDWDGARPQVMLKIGKMIAQTVNSDILIRRNDVEDRIGLIDGVVEVLSADESKVTLDEPGEVLLKPFGQPLLPISDANVEKLVQWQTESELSKNLGLASTSGPWQIALVSFNQETNIAARLADFNGKGFAARHVSVDQGGKRIHRIVLPGFVTFAAANKALFKISQQMGIADAWIVRAD